MGPGYIQILVNFKTFRTRFNVLMINLIMPGGHLLSFDRNSRFNVCWTQGKNQHAVTIITLSFWYMHEMCGYQRSLHFSSSNMESDEDCHACTAVIVLIVAAAMIDESGLSIS